MDWDYEPLPRSRGCTALMSLVPRLGPVELTTSSWPLVLQSGSSGPGPCRLLVLQPQSRAGQLWCG